MSKVVDELKKVEEEVIGVPLEAKDKKAKKVVDETAPVDAAGLRISPQQAAANERDRAL